MTIDLEAIKARDAQDMPALPTLDLFAQQHPADEELRNAIAMIRDRHELLEEVKRLRDCLLGVASCGTCSACRGAALLALGTSEFHATGADRQREPEWAEVCCTNPSCRGRQNGGAGFKTMVRRGGEARAECNECFCR